MRKSILMKAVLVLFSVALFAAPVRAQDAKASDSKPPETRPQADIHYYHLEFVLKELGDDGRVINSRTYHTNISTEGKFSSVRTGTKIPIRTSDKPDNVTYLDVGVSIDCSGARDTAQGLSMQISTEISSLANPPNGSEPSTPMVRQNKWQAVTLVPIGKPIVVFSSDNLENKGRMQVEVTATPVR
jgi:hypothetical protein